MTDEAYIIGRFQPLHLGHEDLIDHARDSYETVTIITAEGRDHPSDRNPLSLQEREELLETVYDDAQDVTFEHLSGDNEAIHSGEDSITEILQRHHDDPYEAVCLTENPETIDALGDSYEIKEPPATAYREQPYRGGHVRERAAEGGDWREGVSEEVASYLENLGFEERMDSLWDA